MYFLEIQGMKNSFPMLSVQTDMAGKQTARLEVTKITPKVLDAATFEIPKGFKAFEK